MEVKKLSKKLDGQRGFCKFEQTFDKTMIVEGRKIRLAEDNCPTHRHTEGKF